MFKFLRKYSKWILAVGGTLLMITFLIPQAIQSLTQQAARRGVTWARVGPDEEKVSSDVLRQCQAELQALDDLGQRVAGLGPIKQPEHWYLLQREADEAGLVGGWASDVLSAEDMQQIIGRTANPARTVDEALGKLNSVNQLMLMYANGARLSDQRLRGYARRTFHIVDARIVVLEGDPEANGPDPTEEEIVAQFETYGDVEPGEGERGFGYRRPDRFKIEWLTIPADGIRAMVEASDEVNAIALAKHWQKHQIDRGFPEVDPSAPVPDVVREDLINELTEAKRDAVERYANNMLLDSWRTLKSTGDGYRAVPDDWAERRVDFTAMAEAVRDKFPGLELPAYQAVGDRWLAVDDIAEFDALNSASTDKFGRPVAVRQLLSSIRDFGGEADIPMQTGLAGPPLRNASRDIVFLRVTDVDPARPARDVDEVRDEITQDLRRLAHFEQLRGQADAIEAAARENGLLYVAVENDVEVQRTTPMSLYDPQWVNFQLSNRQIGASPIPTAVPGLGAAPDAVQTIVERALAFPLDVPLQDQPVEERTFVIPVEDQMAMLVVQLERHTPLDQGRFEQLCQAGLEGLVLTEEIQDTELPLADVFGYDALAARHRFVIQERKDDEADDTDETDAEGDTTSSEPTAAASGG